LRQPPFALLPGQLTRLLDDTAVRHRHPKKPRAVSLPRQNNYPQVQQQTLRADFITTFVFANHTLLSFAQSLILRHLLQLTVYM
jgi:hypothetical protein